MMSETSKSPPARVSRFKKTFWLFGCGAVLLGALSLWLFRSAEPEYQGKNLGQWLRQLDKSHSLNQATAHYVVDEATARPVREMGEVVVPHLIDRLRAGLSSGKRYSQLGNMKWKLPFELFGPKFAEHSVTAREAVLGFMALRENAAGAVPILVSMAEQCEEDARVILPVLASIGAPAVGALSNALVSPSVVVRSDAVNAVGLLEANGAGLVPILISILNDAAAPPTTRCSAARSLGMIGQPVVLVLPELRRALTFTNEMVRANAVVGLMLMKDSAYPAVPDIEAILARTSGQPDPAMVAGLVVLCEDDVRVEKALSRFYRDSHVEDKPANDERDNPPLRETLSMIRAAWTNYSWAGREAFQSAVGRINSPDETR